MCACLFDYVKGPQPFVTQFVQECLSSKEAAPPVVIGGAVQGLLTNKSRNVAGVSLFAAHMPGESCIHI